MNRQTIFRSSAILMAGAVLLLAVRSVRATPEPPPPHDACYPGAPLVGSPMPTATSNIAIGDPILFPSLTAPGVGNGLMVLADGSQYTVYYTNGPVFFIRDAFNTNIWHADAYATAYCNVTMVAPCAPVITYTFLNITYNVLGYGDSDYDGVCDAQEIHDGTDPFNRTSVRNIRLGYWRFNNTNTWVGEAGQLPLRATNIAGVASWSTNAVRIDSTSAAKLAYRDVETNGVANFNCRRGSVRFWFKPDWNSTNSGGTGPGSAGRLLEMGNVATNGWWGLFLNTNGTQLCLATKTNATTLTNLTATINWISNQWQQVVVTYTSNNSTLYVNGQAIVTNGTGITYFPATTIRTNGFFIGSDNQGNNQARGQFEELETFNYPLTASDVVQDYADPVSSTMVVAWGDDTYGQCDVPYGLSTATAVAGGAGHSLALRSDGTVIAWGRNDYGQGSVPTNVAGVSAIAAGYYHNVVLFTNGSVFAWGLTNPASCYSMSQVPAGLTNVTAISANGVHALALRRDGTVADWGCDTAYGENVVPDGLNNVVAVAAGYQHNLVLMSDGTVFGWGNDDNGQCDPPALTGVVQIAAANYSSLALQSDGTVVAWGNSSDVPDGLSNVVAIAASGAADGAYGDYFYALKNDGTVVSWNEVDGVAPPSGLNQITALGMGAGHILAIRSAPLTPVVTRQPRDQFLLAGTNVTFTAKGTGLYVVSYQWQFNGANISGATGTTLTLSNAQPSQLGVYTLVVSNAMGTVTSTNASFYFVTPPVISFQSQPTNQVIVYPTNDVFSVGVTSPGQGNGFPLTYQWRFNGTNVSGPNWPSYPLTADITMVGTYSVVVSNAAGSATAAWQLTPDYARYYTSLAYHLSTNAVARTAGYSPVLANMLLLSNWTYATYNAANLGLLTNSVWSTNCWLHGVKGLTATCIGDSNGLGGQFLITMVSPRHYLRAHHVGGAGVMAFMDTNNVIYWRTFVQQVQVGGSDTDVGILNAELPASVGYLPVLPTNYSRYLPVSSYSYVQGIGMNQDMKIFGSPMAFAAGDTLYWNSTAKAPYGLDPSWNVLIRGGDSSDPERLLIGNQLVLVSQHYSPSTGPNTAFQFNLINQQMHYLSTNNSLGTDYQLTPISLTNWPTFP